MQIMPCFVVEKTDGRTPLLDYLHRLMPVAPRSYLKQLFKSGKVSCNTNPASPEQTVLMGDRIELPESSRVLRLLDESRDLPFVLYESPSTLVVYKPSGLATHSGKGHEAENLTDKVRKLLLFRKETFMTAPVHRLDRPTSGPILFGKGKKAISELGKMLQEHMVEKRYLALTTAGLPHRGLLAGPLRSKNKTKHAETGYQVLETQGDLALLELKLITGRQHQIRKQLADAGFPIAGDDRYRRGQTPGLNRLFLHCHKLFFCDPLTSHPVSIKVALPQELSHFLHVNNFRYPDNQAAEDNGW